MKGSPWAYSTDAAALRDVQRPLQALMDDLVADVTLELVDVACFECFLQRGHLIRVVGADLDFHCDSGVALTRESGVAFRSALLG